MCLVPFFILAQYWFPHDRKTSDLNGLHTPTKTFPNFCIVFKYHCQAHNSVMIFHTRNAYPLKFRLGFNVGKR